MKKVALLIFFLGLGLVGCGSEEPAKTGATVMPDFYKELNTFLAGGSPGAACAMISDAQLQDSRSYARAATGGNLCKGALQENFSFLIDPDSYSLQKIETIDKAEVVRRQGTEVWVQPVSIEMTVDGKKEEVLARSAAVVENGKILSLDGMRLATVAPEQFAENLGSPTVITVDPVNAAYYSDPGSR